MNFEKFFLLEAPPFRVPSSCKSAPTPSRLIFSRRIGTKTWRLGSTRRAVEITWRVSMPLKKETSQQSFSARQKYVLGSDLLQGMHSGPSATTL